MKLRLQFTLFFVCFSLLACAPVRKPADPTFNQKMLKDQQARLAAGEDVYGEKDANPSANPIQSSLWAKSVGSPYIIRNQKASKVGDLITIMIDESSTASSSAKTDADRESTTGLQWGAQFGYGADTVKQRGTVQMDSSYSSEFSGQGTTDRSGRIRATVQAVVETVLPNGTLFVRGRKVITVNQEDQLVEISGFVRPDDIRINNMVGSSLLADADIKYLGDGPLGDKQRPGLGMRLLDFVWPF